MPFMPLCLWSATSSNASPDPPALLSASGAPPWLHSIAPASWEGHWGLHADGLHIPSGVHGAWRKQGIHSLTMEPATNANTPVNLVTISFTMIDSKIWASVQRKCGLLEAACPDFGLLACWAAGSRRSWRSSSCSWPSRSTSWSSGAWQPSWQRRGACWRNSRRSSTLCSMVEEGK